MIEKDNEKRPEGLSAEELNAQQSSDLPDREAMTTLLDLNADIDLALDVAAPIDAAVGANVLSTASVAYSSADQDAPISQSLDGVANATATQTSDIDQGETTP